MKEIARDETALECMFLRSSKGNSRREMPFFADAAVDYGTVTLFARLCGFLTSQPRWTGM